MAILITNDDGIHSEGLLALKAALQQIARVVVVAPDRPRSASAHSITLHKPLRVEKVRLLDGDLGYSSNGTPSDCVSLGVHGIAGEPVELVVAGINRGPNLGWDLTYSGTVSAAMEGAILGIQSFAISIASYDAEVALDYTAKFAAFLAGLLLGRRLPDSVFLNVNVPGIPPDQIVGVEVTRQGKRHYAGRLEKRTDPTGRAYYWLGGDAPQDVLEEDTDVKAVMDNRVSITPIQLDLTGYSALGELRRGEIGSFKYGVGTPP